MLRQLIKSLSEMGQMAVFDSLIMVTPTGHTFDLVVSTLLSSDSQLAKYMLNQLLQTTCMQQFLITRLSCWIIVHDTPRVLWNLFFVRSFIHSVHRATETSDHFQASVKVAGTPIFDNFQIIFLPILKLCSFFRVYKLSPVFQKKYFKKFYCIINDYWASY